MGTITCLHKFLSLFHCHCMAFPQKMGLDMTSLFLYEYLFHKRQSMGTNLPTTVLHRLKRQMGSLMYNTQKS